MKLPDPEDFMDYCMGAGLFLMFVTIAAVCIVAILKVA